MSSWSAKKDAKVKVQSCTFYDLKSGHENSYTVVYYMYMYVMSGVICSMHIDNYYACSSSSVSSTCCLSLSQNQKWFAMFRPSGFFRQNTSCNTGQNVANRSFCDGEGQ